MWELVLLTKAKTLKTIEKKHGIQVEHPSCANSDESFMDLVDEYAIETVHPAIEQLIDVYRELKTKVIMYECSVPHRCGPPVVTMALNQTRSMYANVLIKQQPESGNVVVLAESKTLTLDAIATFAVLIGLRSAEYVTSAVMLRHGYRDQFVIPSSLMKRWNASRCSEEYTACDESTHNDSDVDDDDEGEVAMETDPAEESGSGNNDSESSMETDQPEQSHSSSVDGPSNDPWETINPKNTSSNHAPDSTPDNTNKLDNLKTDNFLARDVNQDSDGESERFRSKDPKFEGATSSLNVRLADPIAEPHHHGPSQTVSENTGRFLGTETYGLTESETNNAVEFPTKDEKRISHGPSQPSSGKLLLSMNKKKHLTGHDKEGLQKLTFDCSSGKLEAGLEFSGKTFAAASFTAYLPNSEQGKVLMRLLKKAFDAQRLFKPVCLDCTGVEMRLKPNGVHLKSELTGENGYPDPTYLDQLGKDLRTLGFEDPMMAHDPHREKNYTT